MATIDERYVDLAFNAAKDYIQENQLNGRLNGKNSQETDDIKLFHSRINNDETYLRGIVAETIDKLLQTSGIRIRIVKNSTTAAKSDRKRNVTYLAGGLGSKDILRYLMQVSEEIPEIEELKNLDQNSALLDFKQFKTEFNKHSAIPLEPYGKIRPLMHGINMALRQIAEENNVDTIQDRNLIAVEKEEYDTIKRDLAREQKTGELNIFAIALTPEQAIKTAVTYNYSPEEAENTVRKFYETYRDFLKENAKNLTLFDVNGNVIFKKRDEEVTIDADALGKWQRSFEPHEVSKGRGAASR